MIVRYLKSATVSIEAKGVKILCDPWLTDGEYYGAWHHYPPFEFDPDFFNDIDYIYVSHIHPDHVSKATLEKLNKNIPVLIHSYESKFLKNYIERIGFSVLELPHNTRVHLKNGVHINILAADNCNPALCAKFFGCGIVEAKYGSTQIDTMSVFDDGKYVVVNTNDCPFELSKDTLNLIKKEYPKIDMLLVGYGGAGPYPQCFNFDENKKLTEANKKKLQFLNQGVSYIRELKPNFVLPFAGTYVLGGKLSKLQNYRGVPEIEEAADYFTQNTDANVILLNSYEFFDLRSQSPSKIYNPTNMVDKENYIKNVLSKRLLDYEKDDLSEDEYWERNEREIVELIKKAFERFERKRKEIKFSSETSTLIFLRPSIWCKISNDGKGISFINDVEKNSIERFVSYKVDIRLLHRILKGPVFAHWNNAEIGSHISFDRNPNVFERGIYYCMNFFHA